MVNLAPVYRSGKGREQKKSDDLTTVGD